MQDNSLMKSARKSFVKKIYEAILSKLIVTMAVAYLSKQSKQFANLLREDQQIYSTSFYGVLVTIVAFLLGTIKDSGFLKCCTIAIFLLSESLLIAYACKEYESQTILSSLTAAFFSILGITFYGLASEQDFTSIKCMNRGVLYQIGWILLTVVLLNFILIKVDIVIFCSTFVFGLTYCIYLLHLTQKITGIREKALELDDYLLGIVAIYINILIIFLVILRLLGQRNQSK